MADKQIVRHRIATQRSRLTPEEIMRASLKVQHNLLNLSEWQNAKAICCYLAAEKEVQTRLLLQTAWQSKKKALVPAYDKQEKVYKWSLLTPSSEIIPGFKDIPEPAAPVWELPERIGLVVVPALAFDIRGGRVGHGSGHYDRLLSEEDLRGAFKAGLAFEWQMVNKIDVESHDVQMNAVVTEKKVYA